MISRTPSPVSYLKRLALLGLVCLGLIPSFSAYAASSAWQGDSAVRVRLISAVEATGAENRLWAGLEVQLAEGWHTYWRSPGEAGVPPEINWSASMSEKENLAAATLMYPAPHRYSAEGIETIGYRDHVIFPLAIDLVKAGKPLILKGQLDILLCNVLCVPKHFQLELSLPAGEALTCLESKLIEDARKKVPSVNTKGAFQIKKIETTADEIVVALKSETPFIAPDIFIENDKRAVFQPPIIMIGENKKEALFSLKLAESLPTGLTLATLPATLTAVDGDRAIEFTYPLSPTSATTEAPYLGFIILLALLGGFLLNLMPCVLPVLSIKIMSVLQHKGKHIAAQQRHFLATFAGIIVSFLILAGVTVALKSTGSTVGWGIQFQQPFFLIFLIIVVLLFAANLLGMYEIILPPSLTKHINKIPNAGVTGDFLTGAFATLLATPCSAPFLGTAIGFALIEEADVIFIIFSALGLGFGLPYLLMAFYPKILSFLPKPGPWMITLRKILSIALLLTAVWLGWIVSNQFSTASRMPTMQWQSFDEKKIPAFVAEGKTVFVDVTADWCLTCKVNKKFVLDSEEIRSLLFNNSHLVAMQADWTKPSETILNYLQRQKRYGIPFYRVYGPAAPEGFNLPELLTPAIVRNALSKASAQKP